MPIEPVGGAGPVPSGARPRRRQTDFAVPDANESDAADAPAAASATAAVPLLTLQAAEMAEAAASADRDAAKQGSAVLGALRDLQLALLGGYAGPGQGELAKLADKLPQAADPALDAVLRAIAQRAAIEQTRRHVRGD